MILGDFKSEPTEEVMATFFQIHSLKNLINDTTCYKNTPHPPTPLQKKKTCFDLKMTNRTKSFQNVSTFETRLSDFHKTTLTILKVPSKKEKPKVMNYQKNKFYESNIF